MSTDYLCKPCDKSPDGRAILHSAVEWGEVGYHWAIMNHDGTLKERYHVPFETREEAWEDLYNTLREAGVDIEDE